MENGYSLGDLAAVTGKNNENGFCGADSWVLIILFALIFGNGGFGGFGNNGYATATTADIQRAVDLNSIQRGQADIMADIQRGIYEQNSAVKDAAYNNLGEIRDVQNAVALGNANIINNLNGLQYAMQQCCCETKGMIQENRFLSEKNAAAIMANDTANTQKILDAITGNRMADMQNQINQLQLQNAVAGVVRYPMATAYTSGANPFCASGCGTAV